MMTKAGRGNMMKNQRNIAQMFSPQMMQQLGGMGNIQQMMKSLQAGNLPFKF